MERTVTIIDTFSVTEESHANGSLNPGAWFVLGGQFLSLAELPEVGAQVVVVTPEGQRQQTHVEHVELRHGSAAVTFTELHLVHPPRLSTISFQRHEL